MGKLRIADTAVQATFNLRQNLKRVFTPTQWKRLARTLGFPVRATPTELSFGQWLGLFEFLLRGMARSQVAVPAELP